MKKIRTVFLGAVFVPCVALSGPALARPIKNTARAEVDLSPWVRELNKSCVLFIPGFLSQAIRFESWFTSLEYFNQQMRALKSQGVRCVQLVRVDSEAGSLENQYTVMAAIKKAQQSGRSAILVTHSKGGVDLLEALVTDTFAGGQTKAAIRGWISLQAPFAGTPAADWLLQGSSYISPFWAKWLLKLLAGDMSSLVSLSTERRKVVLGVYAPEIRDLKTIFPVISVATRAADPGTCRDLKTDFVLGRNLRMMMAKGIESDGLVPIDSAFLPGSDRVFLDNVDHAATVMDSKCSPQFDRVKFLNEMLIRLLKSGA